MKEKFDVKNQFYDLQSVFKDQVLTEKDLNEKTNFLRLN